VPKNNPLLPGPNKKLTNGIYTGDSYELVPTLKDNSVDFIITDPVYDRVEDYGALARWASQKLKEDRACLAFCSTAKMYDAHQAMSEYLDYCYTLRYTVVAKASRLVGLNVFTWTTPVLWFAKGKGTPIDRTIDTIVSHGMPKTGFKWNKNPEAVRRWIRDFTSPGDIVLDPFCGTGVVPAMAKSLSRRWIAIERYPERAAEARSRVFYTQRSLITGKVVQSKMF